MANGTKITMTKTHAFRLTDGREAVMNGERLFVAGRLLGYRQATTTNRYVHLDDVTLRQAAERVAVAIQGKPSHTACWKEPYWPMM